MSSNEPPGSQTGQQTAGQSQSISLSSADLSESVDLVSQPSAVEVGFSIEAGNGKAAQNGLKNGQHKVYRHALLAVVYAFSFNVVIASLKLFVAVFISRSSALFSEGLHSFADALNSLALLVGILQGKKAPDKSHPFGYGLEINFWALFASFALLVSSIWAIWAGLSRLFYPEPLGDPFWGIVVLVVSLVLELFAVLTAARAVLEEVGVDYTYWSAIPKAFGQIRNVVSPTTRFVFYEDSLAFVGAAVALIALVGTDYMIAYGWLSHKQEHLPDAIASVIIGCLLVILAVNLFRYNRGFLTGLAAPDAIQKKIIAIVNQLHGVSEVQDLKTIDRGMSGLVVNMTVEVEPDTPVKDVDDLTNHIKEKLVERIPSISQVFVEVLADEDDQEWEQQFNVLIDQGLREEVIGPRDAAILRKVYAMTDSQVQDIMVPRPDVVMLKSNLTLGQAAKVIIEEGYSRYPVSGEDMDDILGFVESRDVFQCFVRGEKETSLKTLIKDLIFYPETKPIGNLLEEFKKTKLRMAAVADEYGGFAGIVTIEDVLEEIVGDIWTEMNVESVDLIQTSSHSILVSGRYDIEDLNNQYGLNIPTEEFVSVGGFVFGQLGREPEIGDEVKFEDMVYTVTQSDGPRITLIRIESPTPLIPAVESHPSEDGNL